MGFVLQQYRVYVSYVLGICKKSYLHAASSDKKEIFNLSAVFSTKYHVVL